MQRRAIILLAAVCAATLALAAPIAQAKKVKPFSETKAVNAPIPQDAVATNSVPVLSTITVPKKYKKSAVVGDVNVTGIQTTGSAAGAANDLIAYLVAPNGRTTWLFVGVGTQSLGPWTLDDDSPNIICQANVPCGSISGGTLYPPYAGTSNLIGGFGGTFSAGSLSNFDGVKMRGTWTFVIADTGPDATTSVLNAWGLRIKPAKPVPE
jgi:hypothetical protein